MGRTQNIPALKCVSTVIVTLSQTLEGGTKTEINPPPERKGRGFGVIVSVNGEALGCIILPVPTAKFDRVGPVRAHTVTSTSPLSSPVGLPTSN